MIINYFKLRDRFDFSQDTLDIGNPITKLKHRRMILYFNATSQNLLQCKFLLQLKMKSLGKVQQKLIVNFFQYVIFIKNVVYVFNVDSYTF